jgi:acetoin utilization protein AcuB
LRHDPIDPAGFDILDAERPAPPVPAIRVMDRLTTPVMTVHGDASVEDAWQLMMDRRIRHLPVIDDEDRLVGIVSDRDLRPVVVDPFTHAPWTDLAATPSGLSVEEIMRWTVITMRPETEIREAARLMQELKIGAVPVVEGDEVVGILTEIDVLQAFVEILDKRMSPTRVQWGSRSG